VKDITEWTAQVIAGWKGEGRGARLKDGREEEGR
jgi:hypothetical protein